ncbi:MAG: CinA family nicotinamide mononucleotide deamidase-related protein [Candidatus Methylomirabilia bacterium]
MMLARVAMRAEIISAGSELLLGQIVDTNSATIARHLAAIGVDLYYKTIVGDNLGRLSAVIRQARARSQVVIVTGGLGPTADDVTRQAVAVATDRELEFSESLMAQIEAFFASRGFRLSPSNRRQAYVPQGAIEVENPVGTAPAFIVEVADGCVIALPGVPREMEYLLVHRMLPYLRDRYGIEGEIRLRILKAVGLGESRIGELIADFMEQGRNPTVGTLAHLGQVDVRIAAKGVSGVETEALIAPVETEIRRRLGEVIFGADADTLEGLVAKQLEMLGGRVAVAEFGTAGAVAARLVNGAGTALAAGVTLPDATGALKLGVDLTSEDGAAAGARLLAGAVRKWSGAIVGVATVFEEDRTTSPPVTIVGLGVSLDGRDETREYRLGGDLPSIRIRAATLALDLLRRTLPPAR